MPEIELTPTREDALQFADYLAEHPQPEPITIPLAALYELAERAQIRAQVIKIVAETNQVAAECINAGFDAQGIYHDPQLDGLRGDIAIEQNPRREILPTWAMQIIAFVLSVAIGFSVTFGALWCVRSMGWLK